MLARNGAGPDRRGDDGGARVGHAAGKQPLLSRPSKNSQAPLRAELISGDTCACGDMVATGGAPTLALCRQLLAAGLDPDRALDVFRNNTLALRVRSIREAAGLEVNSHGTAFIARRERRTASPMRKTEGRA